MFPRRGTSLRLGVAWWDTTGNRTADCSTFTWSLAFSRSRLSIPWADCHSWRLASSSSLFVSMTCRSCVQLARVTDSLYCRSECEDLDLIFSTISLKKISNGILLFGFLNSTFAMTCLFASCTSLIILVVSVSTSSGFAVSCTVVQRWFYYHSRWRSSYYWLDWCRLDVIFFIFEFIMSYCFYKYRRTTVSCVVWMVSII